MKININDKVRFRLSEEGRKRIAHLNATDEVYRAFPLTMKEDAEGYCDDQLWHVMQIFGPAISMGSPPPFEGCELEFINQHPPASGHGR